MSNCIDIDSLIGIGAALLSDDGENTEYDRAIAELITEARGLPMECVPDTMTKLREAK